MTKIGINGFGRIGRFVFRASTKRNDIEVVAINDLLPVDYMAYMLKYDTMHGAFEGSVDFDLEKSLLIVNGKAIRVTACRDPKEINWGAVGAEYVVESTGLFLTKEKAQGHIEAGAKYVVMSAPSKDDTPMFVCGVNLDKYDKKMHRKPDAPFLWENNEKYYSLFFFDTTSKITAARSTSPFTTFW